MAWQRRVGQENSGSRFTWAAAHKWQHKTQPRPGKDKCGKWNFLIDRTVKKRMRVRMGNWALES